MEVEDDIMEYERQAQMLEDVLVRLGLEPFRAELLMDRFVDNMSLPEIVRLRGYTSATTVQRLIKDTIYRLQKVGVNAVKYLLKETDDSGKYQLKETNDE